MAHSGQRTGHDLSTETLTTPRLCFRHSVPCVELINDETSNRTIGCSMCRRARTKMEAGYIPSLEGLKKKKKKKNSSPKTLPRRVDEIFKICSRLSYLRKRR